MKVTFTYSIAKFTLVSIISLFAASVVNASTATLAENTVIITASVNNQFDLTVTARMTDRSVLLDWNTVTEANGGHFEVERSSDMTHFKTVALVLDGFATEGTGKRYAFKEDAKVVTNNQSAYYRLKQFDAFGNISYSEIVKVEQTLIP